MAMLTFYKLIPDLSRDVVQMWRHISVLDSSRLWLWRGSCSQYKTPDARPTCFVSRQDAQERPHGCRNQKEKSKPLLYKILKHLCISKETQPVYTGSSHGQGTTFVLELLGNTKMYLPYKLVPCIREKKLFKKLKDIMVK